MNRIGRNVFVFALVALAWVFFFIPNPLLNFLNVQQLQVRLPNVILFAVVPIVLALVSMFGTAGTLSARIVLTLSVPVLGVAACLAFWASSIYSDESLLGAWLYALPPIAAYVVGVVIAILMLRRRHVLAGSSHSTP